MLPDEDWTLPDWEDTGGYPPGYEEPDLSEHELAERFLYSAWEVARGPEVETWLGEAAKELGEDAEHVRAAAGALALDHLRDYEEFPSFEDMHELLFRSRTMANAAYHAQPHRRDRVRQARSRERGRGVRRRRGTARRAAAARSGAGPGDDGPGDPPPPGEVAGRHLTRAVR